MSIAKRINNVTSPFCLQITSVGHDIKVAGHLRGILLRINENAVPMIRCGAVRSWCNELLDIAKYLYKIFLANISI